MVSVIERWKLASCVRVLEQTGERVVVDFFGLVHGFQWAIPFFMFLGGFLCLFEYSDLPPRLVPLMPVFCLLCILTGVLVLVLLVRKHVKCIIIVMDGRAGRMFVLQETFGTNQKVLFARDLGDVSKIVTRERRGDSDVSWSELEIQFTDHRRFLVETGPRENLAAVKESMEHVMAPCTSPRGDA